MPESDRYFLMTALSNIIFHFSMNERERAHIANMCLTHHKSTWNVCWVWHGLPEHRQPATLCTHVDKYVEARHIRYYKIYMTQIYI